MHFKGKNLKIMVEVINMPDYQKMYALLFNAATDALQALGALDLGQTRAILVRAQQQAEEMYLEDDDNELSCRVLEQ